MALRLHTKTHKMSALSGWQVEAGARGITVAKVEEAEVMAQAGLDDVFIANQIVGRKKLERIRQLSGTIDISFVIDSIHHVEEADAVFKGNGRKAQVVVEIEVCEKCSGIIEAEGFKKLLEAIGTYAHCAASVLTSVISKPTQARVITDVGAKGLTMQTRTTGITRTEGLGLLSEYGGVHIDSVFDEHAIIYDEAFNRKVAVGEKVRIIPNQICPVSNLYDTAWLVSDGEVLEEISVDARGRLQ